MLMSPARRLFSVPCVNEVPVEVRDTVKVSHAYLLEYDVPAQ
jgi:hypothetical protein